MPTRTEVTGMTLREIRKKASELGVKNYSRFRKYELIKQIQDSEGNVPCFGAIPDCSQYECLWRPECQQ
jgi:hypothetical protein